MSNSNNNSATVVSHNTNTPNVANKLDYFGIGILVAMGLKCFALIPTIAQVAKTGTVEEISIVTPIFYTIAFLVLFIISFLKKYYIPMLLFIIGVVTAIILLVQKIIYEKSNKNNNPDIKEINDKYFEQAKNYDEEVDKYQEALKN
jgi:hypothetical protein